MASIDIRDVDADVHEAVVADAQARNVSINDVYEGILAAYVAQEFSPSGYPYTDAGTPEQLLIRVPAKLKGALRSLADTGGLTVRGLVMRVVARHYQLPERSARKRVVRAELDPDLLAEARRRKAAGESARELSKELGVGRNRLTRALRT